MMQIHHSARLFGIVFSDIRLVFLEHNENYVKATTAYVTMTRTELFEAPDSWIQWIFSKDFFISRRNFNQLDTTSNVTYRHEIMCTGNRV